MVFFILVMRLKKLIFINSLIKLVSHEIKLPPQEIKQWSLQDLVDIVSDIINKNDVEAFMMLDMESKK